MRDASEVLLGAFERLPRSTNVFLYLAEAVQGAVYPRLPRSFRDQLYALMTLFSISIVLFTAAFLLRAIKIGQWIPFRLTRTSRGTYLTPHFVLSWQLLSVVFLGLLIGYAYEMSLHAQGQEVGNYLVWVSLEWIVVWDAAVLTLWSLAVALCVPTTRSVKSNRWIGSAACLNIVFISIIVCCTTVVTSMSFVSQHRYSRMVAAEKAVRLQFLAAGATYTPGTPAATVEAQLEALVPALQLFLDRQHAHDVTFRAIWAVYLFNAALLLSLFFLVAVRYFRHFSADLRAISESSHAHTASTNGTGGNGGGADPAPGLFKKTGRTATPRTRLRRAYIDAVCGTAAIIGGATINAALSLSLAIVGSETANDTVPLQLFTLVALYSPALVALPSSALALLRAWQCPSAGASAARPQSVGGSLFVPTLGRRPLATRTSEETNGTTGTEEGTSGSTLQIMPLPVPPPAATSGSLAPAQGATPAKIRIEVQRTVRVEVEEERAGAGQSVEMLSRAEEGKTQEIG
ncbi:hypothetical protein JCM8097_000789 [Rhodosporidiobolus ruineniae]